MVRGTEEELSEYQTHWPSIKKVTSAYEELNQGCETKNTNDEYRTTYRAILDMDFICDPTEVSKNYRAYS